MARFGFARACARGQVLAGILFMVLGVAAAGAALLRWPVELPWQVSAEWRGLVQPAAALVALLLGILIGSWLVLRGQLLLMLLEIRRTLARIDRHLRRSARREEDYSDQRDATARLLPRR